MHTRRVLFLITCDYPQPASDILKAARCEKVVLNMSRFIALIVCVVGSGSAHADAPLSASNAAVGDAIVVNTGDVAVITVVRSDGTVNTYRATSGHVIAVAALPGTVPVPRPPTGDNDTSSWVRSLNAAIDGIPGDEDDKDLMRRKLGAAYRQSVKFVEDGTLKNIRQWNTFLGKMNREILADHLDSWAPARAVMGEAAREMTQGHNDITTAAGRASLVAAFNRLADALDGGADKVLLASDQQPVFEAFFETLLEMLLKLVIETINSLVSP